MSPEMIWKGLPSSSKRPLAASKRCDVGAECATAEAARSRKRAMQARRRAETMKKDLAERKPEYRKLQRKGYFGQQRELHGLRYGGIACSPTRRQPLHRTPEHFPQSSKFALRPSTTHRSPTAAERTALNCAVNLPAAASPPAWV